jgi:AcrR family transcriptional regulator
MPPKPKVKKEDILEIAFAHVRQHGWEGMTARYLAEKLNTSTKPIYFHFKSMKMIEDMVVKKAMQVVLDYTTASRTGDVWIDQAVGVVMFALEEKHLFRAIFDEKHVNARKKYSAHVWKINEENLAGYSRFNGLSENQVEMIRRVRWVFVHGLASLVNISNWPWEKGSEAKLIEMVQRVSQAFYNEFKADTDLLFSSEPFPEEP